MKKYILYFVLFTSLFHVNLAFSLDEHINNIRIFKSKRIMQLKYNDKILKEYKIALGGNPVGAKECEGDEKTPEGKYTIEYHNPKSSYHLSLKISYPLDENIAHANKKGCNAGSFIMIHGFPNWAPNKLFDFIHNHFDWTDGCIAVTDEEMDEIYHLVQDGTPVEIMP